MKAMQPVLVKSLKFLKHKRIARHVSVAEGNERHEGR